MLWKWLLSLVMVFAFIGFVIGSAALCGHWQGIETMHRWTAPGTTAMALSTATGLTSIALGLMGLCHWAMVRDVTIVGIVRRLLSIESNLSTPCSR